MSEQSFSSLSTTMPTSESGRYYSEDQIEARLFTIRHAHKAARQLARECVQKTP